MKATTITRVECGECGRTAAEATRCEKVETGDACGICETCDTCGMNWKRPHHGIGDAERYNAHGMVNASATRLVIAR